MRKGLRALLAAAAVVALGTGAAWAKTDVRVTVAYYSPETGPIFEGMAKDFEAANPDVDIQIEVVNWDNLQQKLTTDIQGGTAPDIAIIGTRWLVDYSANDIAEPLDSYMTPEVKDRFIEAFLAPSTIDGKLWGCPSPPRRAPCITTRIFSQRRASPIRRAPGTTSLPPPTR